MIYEEGDYFGCTVNIAARIASQAAKALLNGTIAATVAPSAAPVSWWRLSSWSPLTVKVV